MRERSNRTWRRAPLGVAMAVLTLIASACSSSGPGSSGAGSGAGTTASGSASTPANPASSGAPTGTSNGAGAGTYPSGGVSQDQANAIINKLEGPIPKATGHTTRGINGKTITVEGVVDVTAGGQTINPGACAGAKARFERAAKEGPINGYTINYKGCVDSQSNSATALQDVQHAVEVDKAFAIVPMDVAELDGAYLNTHHVPYFGLGLGPAYCPGWASLSFGFSPVGGVGCTLAPADPKTSVLTDAALQDMITGLKLKSADVKWALLGSNISFLKILQNDYATIIKDHLGGQVVYNESPVPAPGAPPLSDWSPVAQQIVSSGATIVYAITQTASQLEALVSALKSNGYTGAIMSPLEAGIDLTDSTQASILQGVYFQNSWTSLRYFPHSYMNTVAKDLSAVGANPNLADDQQTQYAYMSADLFLQALKSFHGTLTAEALVNMMNDNWTYHGQPNGWSSNTYPAARLSQLNYSSLSKVDNGKLVPILTPRQIGQNFFMPSS